MSLNFSIGRLSQLGFYLALFALFGGFSEAALSHRGWFKLFLLFAVSAVFASIVDHEVGLVDRTNLRFAYVFIGGVLMLAAILWLRGLLG